MGDRVQVRNSYAEPWMKGTVKKLADGRPRVKADEGRYSGVACSWQRVQPLVIA